MESCLAFIEAKESVMMKVGLLHFGFEDYTVQLANHLVNNVKVVLIRPEQLAVTHHEVIDPRIHRCNFKKYRVRDLRNFYSMRTMLQLIREQQLDVLHVQETRDPWYDLTLLLNEMPPLVTTIHDVHQHPGDRDLALGSRLTRQIPFRRSQQLIVHSNLQKETLVESVSTTHERVNVIPHGELGSLYQHWTQQFNITRDPSTLLFFGRIWPYKGLQYLVDAIPLVAKKIPDVRLIVAGKGENLRQYFPEGWDSNRYEIINRFISQAEVAKLFQRSTIAVLPYTEASQSGVALISYGLGTPVIASKIGGLGELIQHERDGLLVLPGNSQALANVIIRLLSDPLLQERLRVGALERCHTDLSWSTIAVRTIEVYQKAIDLKKVI
jgi:alpha-maltose-1-phosphate synthase